MAGYFIAENGPHDAIDIGDRQLGTNVLSALYSRLADVQQSGHVNSFLQAMILAFGAVATDIESDFRLMQDLGKIKSLCLPVIYRLVGLQYVTTPHHFVQGAETKLSHDLAQLFGNETHEVDDIFRLAGEVLAQLGILSCHPCRTGIAVADTHHDAPQSHQRSGGKAELLGAQQSGNSNITAGLQLAVGFDDDTAAQVVEQQCLVGFRQAKLPGETGVFDAGDRRCAGAAIIPADQHDVGVGLGHPGSNSTDTDFRYQLDADPGTAVGVFQIVDQFSQIFDRVYVMVRRWRYQTDPRCRMAGLGDPWVDLVPRQLATFARLGALRHLDLQFSGIGQVITGNTEASRGHLLDIAVLRISLLVCPGKTLRVFTPLAGVGSAADTVHGDRQGFVGLLTDGTV